eukprot:403372204
MKKSQNNSFQNSQPIIQSSETTNPENAIKIQIGTKKQKQEPNLNYQPGVQQNMQQMPQQQVPPQQQMQQNGPINMHPQQQIPPPQGMPINGPGGMGNQQQMPPQMMPRQMGGPNPNQGPGIPPQMMQNQMRSQNSYPSQQQQYPPGGQQQQQFGGQVPPPQGMYPAGGPPQYQRSMPPQQMQQIPPGAPLPNQYQGVPPQGIPPYGMPQQQPNNPQQYPPHYGMNNPNMIAMQHQTQIQKFDQTVQSYVRNLQLEKAEIGGIQVEMQNSSFNYLYKNYESFLKRGTPQEKLNFLENTLLNRKSLINKNSKRYKAICKQKRETQPNVVRIGQRAQLKCPVYGCFRDMPDEASLVGHYNDQHQNLKQLGLDLTLDPSQPQTSKLKGKIHNNLLTQTIIMSILHKGQVKELIQELNDELPPVDV